MRFLSRRAPQIGDLWVSVGIAQGEPEVSCNRRAFSRGIMLTIAQVTHLISDRKFLLLRKKRESGMPVYARSRWTMRA